MNDLEIRGLSHSMATIVRDFFEIESAKLRASFEQFVATRIAELPAGPKGDRGESVQGEPGKDGKDADPVDVDSIVLRVAELIPAPKDGVDGKDGTSGRDGTDGVNGRDGIDGKDGTSGRDGTDGANGRDGEPGKDGRSIEPAEAEAFMERTITAHVARWELEFERRAQEQFQRAIDRMPKPEDGKNGFELEDLDVTHDGDGNVTLTFKRGTLEKTFQLRFPRWKYKRVFREGEGYREGDGVTFGGSLWMALKDDPAGKPSDPDSGWQLAIKKGERGIDGVLKEPKISVPVKL